MNRNARSRRLAPALGCSVDRLDNRLLLSSLAAISPLLTQTIGYLAVRPNTPVMPFATPAKKASYIDPTASIKNGNTVVMGYQDFVGPYAALDGTDGAIKIGNGSEVLDNASVIANSGRGHRGPVVLIGGAVVIGFGARIIGPSTIGSYSDTSEPVSIGANALIDGATIEAGAIVSPLARVGPRVTLPSGYMVPPGANVTTDAEASNPKLGMVAPVTSSALATITKTLSANETLAAGYVTLYQGNSATGASPGATPTISGVNNGDLAAIMGANKQPVTSFVSKPSNLPPYFLSPHRGLVPAVLATFPARSTGNVEIGMQAWQAALHMGRANAYRADQGQPIVIGSIAHMGPHVTINSPLGGQITIGNSLRAGAGAVILSGPNVSAKIGDNVNIGAGAVVSQTSLGSNSTVSRGAYLMGSTFPANTVIPPKAIYINNKFEGYVSW